MHLTPEGLILHININYIGKLIKLFYPTLTYTRCRIISPVNNSVRRTQISITLWFSNLNTLSPYQVEPMSVIPPCIKYLLNLCFILIGVSLRQKIGVVRSLWFVIVTMLWARVVLDESGWKEHGEVLSLRIGCSGSSPGTYLKFVSQVLTQTPFLT